MTNSSPKERLKEERKRLKLTQTSIAELFGIKRETWSRYEAGTISPGMDVLIAFAKLGADVQYILTGEQQAGCILSKEEKELITMYRDAPLAIKAAALGALTAGTAQQSGVKQIIHGDNHGLIVDAPSEFNNITFNNSAKKRK